MRAVKWLGSALCVIGMVLAAVPLYPHYLIFSGVGSGLWLWVGAKTQEDALAFVEAAAVICAAAGLVYWFVTVAKL